jgi:hypothetical protein
VTEKKTRENYLRVTEILYPFSGLDKIDPAIVAHAAARGTKVHQICEGIMQGLGEIGVDDETRGYVESFKKWWELGHKVVEMEKRFYDNEKLFNQDKKVTGQADLIIDTPEGLAIIDLKTSSKASPSWAAQGAAYAYLARKAGYDIKKIYFIHLNKWGILPTMHQYAVDDSFFLAIFRVYLHFYHKD